MQKVLFVTNDHLTEVNALLSQGWKVVDVKAVGTNCYGGLYVSAYFVLEK